MKDNTNSAAESQQTKQAELSELQPQPAEQAQLSGQMGVIYKITCTLNGKGYVGQTKQKLGRRITEHKRDSSKGRPGIDAAIQKYGWENFTVEVLEECPIEFLNEREIFWIAALETKAPNGYNLTDGGESCLGFKHTDESRAKMSAAKKGKKRKPCSPETKTKIAATSTGRKHTTETKAKIAAALKAYWAKKKLESQNKS